MGHTHESVQQAPSTGPAAAGPAPASAPRPPAGAALLQGALGNQVTRRLLQAGSPPDAVTPVTPLIRERMADAGPEGSPLPGARRQVYETLAGRDLSGVRMHVGPRSGAAARTAGARAFTVGDNVYVDPAEHRPETPEGRALIAHEMANVVHDRPGAVARQPVGTPVSPQEADALEEGWQLENEAAQDIQATSRSAAARALAHRLELLLNALRPDHFTSEEQLLAVLGSSHKLAASEEDTLSALATTLPRQSALDQHGMAFPNTWADKLYNDFHLPLDLDGLRTAKEAARKYALKVARGISGEVWDRGLPITLQQAADLAEDDLRSRLVPYGRTLHKSADVFDEYAQALLQWRRTSYHYGYATYYESDLAGTIRLTRRGEVIIDAAVHKSMAGLYDEWQRRLATFADAAASPDDMDRVFNAMDIQIKKGGFHHPILGTLTSGWPAEGLDALTDEIRQVDRKIAATAFDDCIAQALVWSYERDYFSEAGLEVWAAIKENGWKALATAVVIFGAQYVPYAGVALDVILMMEFGYDALSTITELAAAFKDAGTAKSVLALEHASARLARILTGTGAQIAIWAITWGAGKGVNKAAKWRAGKRFLDKYGNSPEARNALSRHLGDVAKAEAEVLERERLRIERNRSERIAAEQAAARGAKPSDEARPAKTRPAEETEPGGRKPDEAEPPKPVKPAAEKVDTEPATQRSAKEAAREATHKKLAEIAEKQAEIQRELDRVRREIGVRERRLKEVNEKIKKSSGDERNAALEEREALKEQLSGADGGLRYERNVLDGDLQKLKIDVRDLTEALKLERPYLRAETRRAIEMAAERTPDGRFVDAVTRKPIDGPFHYGHIRLREHRRLALEAQRAGMNQAQFNDWVNSHPGWFRIEAPETNLGHLGEEPGID